MRLYGHSISGYTAPFPTSLYCGGLASWPLLVPFYKVRTQKYSSLYSLCPTRSPKLLDRSTLKVCVQESLLEPSKSV